MDNRYWLNNKLTKKTKQNKNKKNKRKKNKTKTKKKNAQRQLDLVIEHFFFLSHDITQFYNACA